MLNITEDYVLDRAAEQAHSQYLLDCFMGRDTYKQQKCYTPDSKRDIVDKAPKPETPEDFERKQQSKERRREYAKKRYQRIKEQHNEYYREYRKKKRGKYSSGDGKRTMTAINTKLLNEIYK